MENTMKPCNEARPGADCIRPGLYYIKTNDYRCGRCGKILSVKDSSKTCKSIMKDKNTIIFNMRWFRISNYIRKHSGNDSSQLNNLWYRHIQRPLFDYYWGKLS